MRQYENLPKCRRAFERYVLREGHGVELEVGSMLYAVVRLMKPDICVESGLFIADSAEWIGKALKDNGHGVLHTCDVEERRIEPARARLCDLPVTVHHCPGRELIAMFPQIDFAHIDSGDHMTRQEELLMLSEENVTPMGHVCFHDACVGYENLYDAFAKARNWPHLLFPSMVGMAVFQRPE